MQITEEHGAEGAFALKADDVLCLCTVSVMNICKYCFVLIHLNCIFFEISGKDLPKHQTLN